MKYFGTDGIRGAFGKWPISPKFFRALAVALEEFFSRKHGKRQLTACVGRDTRASGQEIFQALTQRFSDAVTVFDCQILPTPAIAEITNFFKCDFGIAITASHNQATDNGIKIFNHRGEKLTIEDEQQLEEILEKIISTAVEEPLAGPPHIIDIHQRAKAHYCSKYFQFLPSGSLAGTAIVMDSANGATYEVAKTIFETFGAKLIHIGNSPDGSNINAACGSEHTARIQNLMTEEHAFIGIAYDGDGDRVVIFDETGQKIDGDILIGILAYQLHAKNELPNNVIVTTVTSNLALDIYLKRFGINVIRCDVGDRNVYQTMLSHDCFFGGENSGHLIFRKFSSVGDGITTAILLLSLLRENNVKLSQIKTNIDLFSQKSFNITVSKKVPIEEIGNLQEEIDEIAAELPSPGRVVVRYSGTEPKLRVIVESADEESTCHAWGKLKQSIIKNIDNIE